MGVGRLLLSWAALLGLLAMTIAASFLPIGNWRQLANLVIAFAKAALILWIFMKMREETALGRLAVAIAAVLLLVLASLLAADYFLRPPANQLTPVPPFAPKMLPVVKLFPASASAT